jgi:glycosyltransferase involved in cell wall biosynthesis
VSVPAPAAPRISVVLCTHNRAAYLRPALASLVGQTFPRDAFEVLVVDNRSTDDTPAAVDEAVGAGLPARRIFEPTLGLCHARNTGWRAARAPLVAYFDDDAVADPEWLAVLHDALVADPGVGAVGGPVRPIWEAPRPSWLSDAVARVLTIVEWGGAHEIRDLRQEWLAGANMALPRRVLEEVGGFSPSLDRVGHNMLSSGDVFLEKQVVARGYRVRYEPRAAVGHVVPPGRLTQDWFRRRYYWQGISDAVMLLLEHDPSPLRRLRWAAERARRLLASPGRLRALHRPTADPAAFEELCWTWIAVGQVAGLLGKARR